MKTLGYIRSRVILLCWEGGSFTFVLAILISILVLLWLTCFRWGPLMLQTMERPYFFVFITCWRWFPVFLVSWLRYRLGRCHGHGTRRAARPRTWREVGVLRLFESRSPITTTLLDTTNPIDVFLYLTYLYKDAVVAFCAYVHLLCSLVSRHWTAWLFNPRWNI